MLGDVQHPSRLLDGHADFVGDLFDRRFAAQFLVQDFGGAANAAHRLDHVYRDTNRPGVVGDSPRDRLANPPGRVRAELVAATVLVLVDRAHQAGVAFLDQVEEAQPAIAILLRDRDDQSKVGAGKRSFGLLVLGEHALHRPELLFEQVRRLQNQFLKARQFLPGGADVVGGHHIVDARGDDLLKLTHLLTDAVQFDLHRLDPAGPKAQLLQERGDLASIATQTPGVHLVLVTVRIGADLLEQALVDVEKLRHRLEVGDHAFADHPFDRQRSGSGLDRTIERHRSIVDLLEQLHRIAGTIVTLEHLAPERHAGDLDLPGQRDLILARQQRDLAHLRQVHADRIIDAAGGLSLGQLLLEGLVFFVRLLFLGHLRLRNLGVLFELLTGLAALLRLDVAFVDQTHPHLIQRSKNPFEPAGADGIVGQRVVHLFVGQIPAFLALGDERLDQLLDVLRLRLFRLWRVGRFSDLRLLHICRLLGFLHFLRHNTDSTKAKVQTSEITTRVR